MSADGFFARKALHLQRTDSVHATHCVIIYEELLPKPTHKANPSLQEKPSTCRELVPCITYVMIVMIYDQHRLGP